MTPAPFLPRPADARRRALTAAARWLPACTRRPALWFSSDPEDRYFAEQHCRQCPLQARCAERGRDEAWGVWGGLDVADRFELVEPVTTPVVEHQASHRCYTAGCATAACRAAHAAYVAERRAWVAEHGAAVTAAPTLEDMGQMTLEVAV